MTTRDNIIYYTITTVVFLGIVLCSVYFISRQPSTGSTTNDKNSSVLAKFNEFAPIIEAIAVAGSFGFVIWVTCFRKTRRDRMDELKLEIQVLLSGDTKGKFIKISLEKDIDLQRELFSVLDPKFQTHQYKLLHRTAYEELTNEGKNSVVNFRRILNDALKQHNQN